MRRKPPLLEASCRLYAALLLALPRALRRRRGDEAVELFRDLYRDAYVRAGCRGLGLLWLRSVGGIAMAAARELRPRGRGTGAAGSRWCPGAPVSPGRKRDLKVEKIARDLWHASRSLQRTPGFAAVAVVTLALGIGANTAIFSVVHGVVLEPLPYPEPERLVYLAHDAPGAGFSNGELSLTPGLYFHYLARSRTLESIGAWRYREVTLNRGDEPERLIATSCTSGLFRVLGVPALLGRTLLDDDDLPDAPQVVVLSHGLWQRRFGGDPTVVGTTIRLSGGPAQVIGVMPRGFAYPDDRQQLWFNERRDPAEFGGFFLNGTARMRPGITVTDVDSELAGLIGQLGDVYDGAIIEVVRDIRLTPATRSLHQHVVGSIEATLWILLGTVGCVLLVACANVANLFLVRAETREREVAVRVALGASRGQLGRFFLSESSLLSVAGGIAGLLLALGGIRLLVAFGPDSIPRLNEVGVDESVVAFTVALALFASVVFGVIPLLRRPSDWSTSLREGGRSATAGRRQLRARNVLVAGQVALALILLTGSFLMVRTYWHIRGLDPGFNASGVLTFRVALPGADYDTAKSASAFHLELMDRLRALPGVTAVGAAAGLPLSGQHSGDPLVEQNVPFDTSELPPVITVNRAGGAYFEAMRIPLIEGRLFERGDYDVAGRPVAIVNRRLAELYWPGKRVLGRLVYPGLPGELEDPTFYEIVGVVGDVLHGSLTEEPEGMIFFPLSSRGGVSVGVWELSYAVRADVPPTSLVGLVRDTVWSMDDSLPIARLEPLTESVRRARAPTAFTTTLLLVAGSVALCLGTVGIYGVVSYVVRQREPEIGLRMALGARAGDVSRMVVRQGGAIAIAGLLTGVAGSLALNRFIAALLFGISATDPTTYVAMTLLLLAVALLASYLPARRAARLDPLRSLRS